MKNVPITPKELRNRLVLDRDNKEIGRVKDVEQELRTGRYSTLQVEVNSQYNQKVECGQWPHLPLSTTDIDIGKDSVQLSQTIEELNQHFCDKFTVNKKEFSPNDLVGRPIIDKERTPIGIVKDFRTPTNNGEFPTLLIELEPDIKKSHSLERTVSIRVRTDSINEIGTDIRLNKDVDELSREWNEISVHI
jgi:sporulation protein YlmC with PRC-barrel domain